MKSLPCSRTCLSSHCLQKWVQVPELSTVVPTPLWQALITENSLNVYFLLSQVHQLTFSISLAQPDVGTSTLVDLSELISLLLPQDSSPTGSIP